jgi:hypothetical protein
MTRRGSLIYYLAAWALGCFFMVVVVWCWDLTTVSRQDLVREADFLRIFIRRAHRFALWFLAAPSHAGVEV